VGVTNVAPSSKRPHRAFLYRAGVRVQGTIIACDASSGSELIFLSHGGALDARAARALPRARHGRRQILTTDTTLALLGQPGERLRSSALLAGFGRPFTLGDVRLELFPSGHGPGAASLLCERAATATAGAMRVVYAGVIGPRDAPAIRPADALCLDATFGATRFAFPAPAEALAEVRRLVLEALALERAPLVLFDADASALAIAATLVEAGVPVRAARPTLAAAAAHGRAGLVVPPLQRFAGTLKRGEALVWPRAARDVAQLGRLNAPTTILASGWAADDAEIARARADHGVALGDRADFADLLRYVEATGAREVALLRAPGDDLARTLAARGIDAYPLGAPRQIALFALTKEMPAHVVSAG
jgi:putative mRNA 3-end processing factor